MPLVHPVDPFAPQRVAYWRRCGEQCWQQRQAPAWLASLTTLKPNLVAVNRCLMAKRYPRKIAQEILDVVLDEAKIGHRLGQSGTGRNLELVCDDKRKSSGGFAGWLADGTPL